MDTSLLTPDNMQAFAAAVWKAVTEKNYFMLAALALVCLVWAAKKFLAPKVPFLGTEEGTGALALGLAVAGGLLNAAMGGAAFGWALVLGCLKVAMAAGGWTLLKNLGVKLLGKMFAKGDAPALEKAAADAGKLAADATATKTAADIINGAK